MVQRNTALLSLIESLPPALRRELAGLESTRARFYEDLSELRLRAGRTSSLTFPDVNYPLLTRLTGEELGILLGKFCRDSVYAYSETLREGYIRLQGGYRVGVAGLAVRERGDVVGVRDVTSLCIRIAHPIRGAGRVAVELFRRMKCRKGILIYAPPGVGKTTLLRDLADTLSSGKDAMRIAVVDCRGELCGSAGANGMIDVLEGYPKARGIEIATRTLAPQAVICDEIGDYEEADSILAVQSSGVPLIASAHGDDLHALLLRPAIHLLDRAGVFGAYIGIRREGGAYHYTVTEATSDSENHEKTLSECF